MASAMIIIEQIEKTVDGAYSEWQIGITDDSARTKTQLGNPLSWLQWQADSTREAISVVNYFIEKGMQDAGCTTKSADFVYILLLDRIAP
jgi:hypothetical protein